MRNWWRRTDDAVKVLWCCGIAIALCLIVLARMPASNGQSALMGFLIGQGAARR